MKTPEKFAAAVFAALREDAKVLIEEAITGSEVEVAVLEENGKLSVFTKDKGGGIAHAIIVDCVINKASLKYAGKNERWLKNQLEKSKLSPAQIFLMTVDDNSAVNIIVKEGI